MSWFVLILSGVFEAVWAVALDATQGFKKLKPTIVFGAALIVSMLGLGYAMREIPTGTAYAVWTGVGAALTVIYAVVRGLEKASVVKLALIAVLIGCVVGLKAVS
ncbi:MAG TPA: multidrug efflux SMR transporter [Propionibacterium sp.]|jgi:quaternary ammonium compound-resistance protein SugE|nr:multidrug efflux SMR transporter [Propionibacterium sp.]